MSDLGIASRPPEELERVLSTVNRLRPLPNNIARLLQVLDDPDADSTAVSRLLSLDPALAAYILRAANLPPYQGRSACSSLQDAVKQLGLQQVRALLAGTSATGPLPRRLTGYRLDGEGLWRHSVAVGQMSRWLAQALTCSLPEEAYTAGLLHDMGKLLLDQFVLIDYNTIVDAMWKHKMALWQVEEQLFGIDHAAVGSLMASRWGFPPHLIEAIRCHHLPYLANCQPALAAIVHIANTFSPAESLGLSALGSRQVHPEALRLLDLNLPALEQMRAGMLNSLEETL